MHADTVLETRFNNFYGAKFARDARERPIDWVIDSTGHGWYELRRVAGFDIPTSRPKSNHAKSE